MKTKKKNIARAIDIAVVSLLIFTIFQFINEDWLYYIGNMLEGFLHIDIKIEVETVRTYFTAIFSGIFASTIVALGFYIVEYQSEKKEKITKLIEENNRLSKMFLKIPYLDCKSEYGELCIDYYFEVISNAASAKHKEKAPQIILSNSERESLEENTQRTKLIKYLEKHKDQLKSEIDDQEISIEQKLIDIAIETHLKLKNTLGMYKYVIDENLETLKHCVFDISRISWLSYRKINKIIGHDEHILRGLKSVGIFDRSAVEDRILILHKRVHERVKLIFEEVELNTGNIDKYLSDEKLLRVVIEKILDAQNGLFDSVYHEFYKEEFTYNKFVYSMAKLNSILSYDINQYVGDIRKYDFINVRKMKIMGGRVLHMKMYPLEVIYGDIYRE